MAKFTVNNVEFEYDLFDADKAELFEKESEKIKKESLKTVEGEKLSAKIRRIGNTVFNAIDTMFGVGKSQELFGDKVNLIDISVTYHKIEVELNKATAQADAEAAKEINKTAIKPSIKVTK